MRYAHWSIENRLHWQLDVVFREDENRTRKNKAPAVMTAIRHLRLDLLQQESFKVSIKKKRLKASWSDSFHCNLLFAKTF